jgi:hypothetical protein
MPSQLKNQDETVSALEGLAFFRNFAILTFNRHVEAVYYKNTETHTEAKRALLITAKDTQMSIANKQLLFFFSLQKFAQQTDERVNIAKGMAEKDPNMVKLKVRLQPAKLYKPDGTEYGQRYISVPHIDESKLGNLRDFTFKHGMVIRLYVFADKKQIKLFAHTETEGDRAINELLKLVDKKWLLGTSEEHSYTGRIGKDVKDLDLTGITSKAVALLVTHPHERPYTVFV